MNQEAGGSSSPPRPCWRSASPPAARAAAAARPALSGEIAGAGSSAQQAAQEAWIAKFEDQNSGATISYDPVGSGGGRDQFIAGGRSPSPAATRRFDTTELPKATQRCAPGRAGPDPGLRLADRDHLQPLGRRQPAALARRRPRRSSSRRSRPGTTRRSRRTTRASNLPRHADHPGQPLGRVRDDGELHRLPHRRPRRASGRTSRTATWPVKGGEAAAQTSGVVEAVKAGDGAIGYADESQAEDLGIAKVKVGNTYVAPSAAGCGERSSSSRRRTRR